MDPYNVVVCLARPASPAPKLPVPEGPTTTGDASANPALVGGGAVAQNANEVGDKVAAGQDLGGHDPKGVLDDSISPALVGGGAIAQTANDVGDKIAAGQDLGGHDPKGVLDSDRNKLAALGLDKAFDQGGKGTGLGDGEARATGPAEPNTAARFLDAGIPTPVSHYALILVWREADVCG